MNVTVTFESLQEEERDKISGPANQCQFYPQVRIEWKGGLQRPVDPGGGLHFSSVRRRKKPEWYQILTVKLTTAPCIVGSPLHLCEWLEVSCPYRNKHKVERLVEPAGHLIKSTYKGPRLSGLVHCSWGDYVFEKLRWLFSYVTKKGFGTGQKGVSYFALWSWDSESSGVRNWQGLVLAPIQYLQNDRTVLCAGRTGEGDYGPYICMLIGLCLFLKCLLHEIYWFIARTSNVFNSAVYVYFILKIA